MKQIQEATSEPEQTAADSAAEMTTEQLLSELDILLAQMETEESLEQTFAMYRKGLELTRRCEEKLGRMEQEMKVLSSGYEAHEQ